MTHPDNVWIQTAEPWPDAPGCCGPGRAKAPRRDLVQPIDMRSLLGAVPLVEELWDRLETRLKGTDLPIQFVGGSVACA